MSQLITRRLPWTNQPQVPVMVDRSNPIGRTITHCMPIGSDLRDVVTGKEIALTNGSVGVDERGKSLRGSGSANCAWINTLNLSAYTKLTISFWLYLGRSGTDEIILEHGTNFVSDTGFIIYHAAANKISAGMGNPGASNVYNCAAPSLSAWHHYQIVLDRTTGAAQGVWIRIDGVEQSLTPEGTQYNVTDSYGDKGLFIFSRANTSLYGLGRLQNLVIRGEYIGTVAEARKEYLDTWQIFAP